MAGKKKKKNETLNDTVKVVVEDGDESTGSAADSKKPDLTVKPPPLSGGLHDIQNSIYEKLLRDRFEYYQSVLAQPSYWWLQDDVIGLVAKHLDKYSYAYLDNFLLPMQVTKLKGECETVYKNGLLKEAGLINGKMSIMTKGTTESVTTKMSIGENAPDCYKEIRTRGDKIAWFDSWKDAKCLQNLLQKQRQHCQGDDDPSYIDSLDDLSTKIGTLIEEVKTYYLGNRRKEGNHAALNDLSRITSRSHHMVACYPGGDARYVKHYDNDGKHHQLRARVLTVLIYLNNSWQIGDGGEICLYDEKDPDILNAQIPPYGGRLVMFFSDLRNPHEVLPTKKIRFSITSWYLDTSRKLKSGEAPPPPVVDEASPPFEETTEKNSTCGNMINRKSTVSENSTKEATTEELPNVVTGSEELSTIGEAQGITTHYSKNETGAFTLEIEGLAQCPEVEFNPDTLCVRLKNVISSSQKTCVSSEMSLSKASESSEAGELDLFVPTSGFPISSSKLSSSKRQELNIANISWKRKKEKLIITFE